MFVNTGAIMTTETPNEMIGVLAHEAAHLAHGDLAGIRQQIAHSSTAALIGALLGVGAAIAGTAAGAPSLGQIGSGIIAGSMHAAQRNILAYQRAQEAAADRSAVDYLNATGQSGEGMVTVLRRLADEALLSARNADPYVQSHRFRPTGFRPSKPWLARANTPGERIRPSSSTATTWSAPSSPASR